MSTVNKEVVLKSIALMTGCESETRVCPSEEKGIRFHYMGKTVKADIDNILSTEHCTVIGNSEVKIMLIEHFMAACAICKINSLDVYLTHYELPILDGSSKKWAEAFKNAGVNNPDEAQCTIKEPIVYLNGKTHLIVLPSDSLNVTYGVNFKHKDLKNRWSSLDVNNIDEITNARTFGYTTELNTEYEPIKHKILDLIGDFYLAGCNILNFKGEIIVKEAGHTVHCLVAKDLKNKLIMEA